MRDYSGGEKNRGLKRLISPRTDFILTSTKRKSEDSVESSERLGVERLRGHGTGGRIKEK